MLGLESGKVSLQPYTEEWAREYEIEEKLLRTEIGQFVIDIQHVGSTSIPGLAAKPIIDIAAAVSSLKEGEKCIEPLIKLGYEYKGDGGIRGRHFFAKGTKEKRTHYMHIEEWKGELWQNHILFRDYLRKHKEFAIEYGELKAELAKKYSDDREAYAACKDEFIKLVLEKAKDELE